MRRIVLMLLGALCVLMLLAGAPVPYTGSVVVSPAWAQSREPPPSLARGISANGLCGLVYAENPLCPAHLVAVSATVGYGYTESLAPVPGPHARLAGALGIGLVPLDWLALSLRIDGRRDSHPPDEDGPDSTMVGDPRLQLRLGRALGALSAIGLGLGVWVPGTRAPSFDLAATTLDLKLLASHRARRVPWSFLGTLGFRWDNSAASAPAELNRVRPGDRLSLNLSASNAMLWVFGVLRSVGSRGEAFFDLSCDLLLGRQAPALRQSPLRANLGGRYFVSRTLQFEATLSVSMSQRPSLAADAPLVPSEPRVYASAGLRYGLPRTERAPVRSNHAPTAAPIALQVAPAIAPGSAPPPLPLAHVTGTVLDASGQPLSEVQVLLSFGGETREAISDGLGRYALSEVPAGNAELTLSAQGFLEQRLGISVVPEMPPLAPQRLEPAAETGVLRCVTRTFGSEPLVASVSVRSGDGLEVAKGESNEQGLFEIQLPPGSYQVIITAAGYRSHRRSVSVSTNGVAILNLDMREQ